MTLIELDILTDDPNHVLICTRYWNITEEGEFQFSVSEITREFSISSQKLPKLVAAHCHAYSTEIKCRNCGTSYIFENRSDFQKRRYPTQSEWLCLDCVKKQKEQEQREQEKLEEYQRSIIQKEFDLSIRTKVNIREFSLEDTVGLLSLIRIGASEDFSYVAPLWSVKQPLAPSQKMQYDTIRQLYRNHLIYVHPKSLPEAFEFDNDKTKSFYLDRVMWALPIGENSSEPRMLVAELENIFLNMDWPNNWFDERLDFCRKIALQECLQYLEVSLSEHKLTFNPGEKTHLVFNNLLEDFSVGQIYSFIWRAAKDAAAFYVRESVPKQHAANTVVGSIQRQGEKARSESWDVKPYRRDFRCPQSMISQVLYDTALHIGDEGFSKPLK